MSDTRKDIHNSDIPLVCRSCEARHRGVCGALTPEQLVELSKHTHKGRYEPDTEVYAADNDTLDYANVMKGVVKLTKLMADGRQQIVGLQFAPDFVGRPFHKNNDVFANAAGPVELCAFPKTVLDDLIKKSPDLKQKLLEQTLKELDESREIMLALGRKTATEKIATFLHLLATHIDPEHLENGGVVEFELPLKRADIADFLGLTIETVSRQFTKLRKKGIIEIENNRFVRIPDLERLIGAMEAGQGQFANPKQAL